MAPGLGLGLGPNTPAELANDNLLTENGINFPAFLLEATVHSA